MRLNSVLGALISILLIDTFTFTSCRTAMFTGLSCQAVDPKFCRFENCVLRPKSRDIKEVSMVVRMLQIPVNNITVRGAIWKRGYTSQSIYHFDIDGCQFWINKRRNPFANMLYLILRLDRYTNMNHSCPYDHDIIVNRLQFHRNLNIPWPISKGDYIFKCSWLAYNVLRGIVTLTLQIHD